MPALPTARNHWMVRPQLLRQLSTRRLTPHSNTNVETLRGAFLASDRRRRKARQRCPQRYRGPPRRATPGPTSFSAMSSPPDRGAMSRFDAQLSAN
jgi:hypothetical protein